MSVHRSPEIYSHIKQLLDIPQDEPIFILRAQDKFSVETIKSYRKRVQDGTRPNLRHLNWQNWFMNMGSVINDFLNWQRDHKDKVKVPD